MRFGVLILLSGIAGAQNLAVDRGVNLYSVAKEQALGANLAQQERAQSKILDSQTLKAYIDGVAGKLAPQMSASKFPFTIAIVAEGDAAEPQVLPGGYIFVSTRLITAARDETEFAAMLAHAMAHVMGRDKTRELTRGAISQTNSLAGAFELQADTIAVTAMSAAGYDPQALLAYVVREAAQDRDARVAGIQAALQALPQRNYTAPASDAFAQFQAEAAR
jgi:predicted Zn-dependent protease